MLLIKNIKAGSTIGYGASYKAIKDIRIALVEFGYADGLPWSLKSTNHQSGGQFYFNNAPTPILGRVSMDIVAIDVTGIKNDIKRGDFVEVTCLDTLGVGGPKWTVFGVCFGTKSIFFS